MLIKAVAAIIEDKNGNILISQRMSHQFMPDYWELPGGKIEPGESSFQAAKRELKEELSIDVKELKIIKTINQSYSDRDVQIEIVKIDQYFGDPIGQEGQRIKWLDIDSILNLKILPTMRPILNLLRLPKIFWITPEQEFKEETLEDLIKVKKNNDVNIIQFRSKIKTNELYLSNFIEICKQYNIQLILNTIDKSFDEDVQGWHLTSQELMSTDTRPCPPSKILGASVHNMSELEKANEVGVDYVFISPIKETKSHPGVMPLSSKEIKKLMRATNIPAYFLGGLSRDQMEDCEKLGAHGIAGITAI